MKTSKVLLIVVVVVIINNVFLLSYFSKDSKSSLKTNDGAEELGARPQSSNNERGDSNELTNMDKSVDRHSQGQAVLLDESVSVTDESVSNAVRQFVQSAEFERVLDNYQTQAVPRHEEMQSRLTSMSASELYSLAIDSSNSIEQKYAQQFLIQNGLGELGVEELKVLYHADGVSKWVQQSLLPQLLEEGDAEAIGWAKQLLNENTIGQFVDSEVYSSIYDADPDFIKEHINNLDLNDFQKMAGAMTFVMQDADLAKSFYEENIFTTMLNSNYLISSKVDWPSCSVQKALSAAALLSGKRATLTMLIFYVTRIRSSAKIVKS